MGRRERAGRGGDRGRLGVPSRTYPVELKVRAVRQVAENGATLRDVAGVFGVPETTLSEWLRRYRRGGLDALMPPPPPEPPRPRPSPKREAVTRVRREHPEYGTRRISDVLRRFEAAGGVGERGAADPA